MGALNDKVRSIQQLILEVKTELKKRMSDPKRTEGLSFSVMAWHNGCDEVALKSLDNARNELNNFLVAVDD